MPLRAKRLLEQSDAILVYCYGEIYCKPQDFSLHCVTFEMTHEEVLPQMSLRAERLLEQSNAISVYHKDGDCRVGIKSSSR